MIHNASGSVLEPLTRRRLVKLGAVGAGALGAGGLLAACGDGSSGGAGTGTSTATPSATPRAGGRAKIVFGDALSSDSPDPQLAFTYFGVAYSGMVFDSLVHLDNAWDVTPMLAQEWEVSPDFRTYTFTLRDDVEFHNGKTLDAQDVVFSFQRIYDEEVGSGGLGLFQLVLDPRGIRALDRRTVQFSLKQADAYFLIKVGHWYGKVVPDGTRDFSADAGSFGTGPFRVVRFEAGSGFQLDRNENYWVPDRPYLDGVDGVVILEPATRVQAVLSGDADLADPPGFPTLRQFDGSDTATILESPFGPATVWGIDTSSPPFADPDFRMAAKMAVDREAFVSLVARDFATVSPDTIVNPNEPYFPEGFEPIPYDPEQARSLLSRSGQPTSGYTIWSTSALRALGDGSTLLRQQWGEIGLQADVRDVSFDELFGKRFLVEKIVANYWGRQHFSTILPLMYPRGAPYSESRTSTPEITAQVAELGRTPLDAGGQTLLDEILPAYQEATAPIWPFHMKEAWGRKRRLEGVEITPVEIVDMRQAHIV